jgi:hypothetical protein
MNELGGLKHLAARNLAALSDRKRFELKAALPE